MVRDEMDNKPAMLTEQQRYYLIGERELEADSERVVRSRIRNRVIRTIRDFSLLSVGLSDGDHEKVFEKGLGQDIRPEGSYIPTREVHKDNEFYFKDGVTDGFAFLYEGLRKVGHSNEEMEGILEWAIERAETPGGGWVGKNSISQYSRKKATVEIDIETEYPVDRLYESLKQGAHLTDEQLGKLARVGKLDKQDLRKITELEEERLAIGMERLSEKYSEDENGAPDC